MSLWSKAYTDEPKRGGGYSTHVEGEWMNVRDLNEVCANLKHLFDTQEKTNKYLKEQVEKLENENWANEELAKMKAKLEQFKDAYYRGFPISEKESEAVGEWQRKHDTEEHNNPSQRHGAIGGGYSYRFYPTAIGTSGVCVCGSCDRRAKEAAVKAGDWAEYQKYMKEHNGEFEFQKLG